MAGAIRLRCGASGPLRAPLENARAFPQLRALVKVRILYLRALDSKKPGPPRDPGSHFWLVRRTGFEPVTY